MGPGGNVRWVVNAEVQAARANRDDENRGEAHRENPRSDVRCRRAARYATVPYTITELIACPDGKEELMA